MASHVKRAKFCLEIQRKLNLEVKEDFKVCEYCELKCCPNAYNKHLTRCKVKKNHDLVKTEESLVARLKAAEIENKELKDCIMAQGRMYENTIKELRLQLTNLEGQNLILMDDHKSLKEIAKQTKITNNTKILNMPTFDLTSEKIADVLSSKYTFRHGLLGQQGVAEFVKENLLTDDEGNLKYACTDGSRKKFKYKDGANKVKNDPKATSLTKMLVDADIKNINRAVCHGWCFDKDGSVDKAKENYALDKIVEVDKLAVDNSVFVNTLSTMTVV